MDYKIIVLDLDGTLTNRDKIITPRTKEALMKAQEAGNIVVLASGRPTAGVEPLAGELELSRAAVPVSWFYEWNGNKEKFTFTRAGSRVLFLAGFYGRYEDGDRFVILTTQANASMAPVHSRMPLVLEKEQVREWILDSGKTKELLGQEPPQLERDCEYEQQTLF